MKNKMMKTAVFSVVYPGVEPYISEFLSSLSKQTDQDFILFLVNDGLSDIEIFMKEVDFNFRVIKKVGLPAELRKIGIQWAVSEGVETIIFADSDDYFANNRIELSKKMLADCDIIFNELLMVGEGIPKPIPMLEKFFEDKMKISKKHIVTGNCMGMSNTAINTKIIPRYFESISNNIIAFDWALFAMCLHSDARTVFTKETKTYYRQHANNIASINIFSEEQILRSVKIKRDHYQLLSNFYEEYILLFNIFKDLFFQLCKNKTIKQKYCEAVKQQASKVSLWWEPIKSLEELGV